MVTITTAARNIGEIRGPDWMEAKALMKRYATKRGGGNRPDSEWEWWPVVHSAAKLLIIIDLARAVVNGVLIGHGVLTGRCPRSRSANLLREISIRSTYTLHSRCAGDRYHLRSDKNCLGSRFQ